MANRLFDMKTADGKTRRTECTLWNDIGEGDVAAADEEMDKFCRVWPETIRIGLVYHRNTPQSDEKCIDSVCYVGRKKLSLNPHYTIYIYEKAM